MSESEVAQLNRELKKMMDMTLSQLQELNQKIYTILNRGKILSDVRRIERTDKFRKKTRNGIEIGRDFLGSEEKVFKCLAYIDLSSQNQKDLLTTSNLLGMEISEKISTNAVIKFLHQYADDPNNKISINEALDLSSKFLGAISKDQPLSPRSDSIARFTSFDGMRQVRWDIEPRHAHGISHFNFEIMNSDKQKLDRYLNELSNELNFNVKRNYHLFVDE